MYMVTFECSTAAAGLPLDVPAAWSAAAVAASAKSVLFSIGVIVFSFRDIRILENGVADPHRVGTAHVILPKRQTCLSPFVRVVGEILGVELEIHLAALGKGILIDEVEEQIALLIDVRQAERAHIRDAAGDAVDIEAGLRPELRLRPLCDQVVNITVPDSGVTR